MKELAILLSKVMLIWFVVQVCFTLVFLWRLRNHKQNLLADEQLPKTAVILCLRGANPFLPNCLRSLLRQNYHQYDLKIVVDNQQDPAWRIANEIVLTEKADNAQISLLRLASTNCSLKCSSLVQAVSDLDDSYKVVALVDADTLVHPNWLRELVSPLMHPQIGATTGYCWYVPTGKKWGSLVRYLWNLSAVVQMYLNNITWGGSLAIKTKVIRETGLLNKWTQAYVEDTMIGKVLATHGWKVKFVPTLLIVNREEIGLPELFHWMKRQLLACRLYHPLWGAVVFEAILTVLLPNVILIFFLTALFSQQWDLTFVYWTYYSLYISALHFFVITLEKAVQNAISYREIKRKLSFFTIFITLIGIPVTQGVYAWALISSLWMSKVTWRGITYRIKSPFNLFLTEYKPYHPID